LQKYNYLSNKPSY